MGQQGRDLAHPGVAPLKMNGREPVYHKYYQVMKVVTFAFKILKFWFSVGVLCAFLPSWPLLCAKIHLEGCRGGQGQHACCGKIDELAKQKST